jgi:hypothetical protein
MRKRSKDTLINRIRQAIAGVQKHYANTPTLSLDGTSVPTPDVIATFQAAVTSIDAATVAETAFHQAVAAQHAAVVKAEATLSGLQKLVDNQLGTKMRPDFGFAVPTRKTPDEATKAQAVAKRAATRAARGTKGPRQKAAIKGQVPATPPTATPAKPQ